MDPSTPRTFLAVDLDSELLDAAHGRAASMAERLRGLSHAKVRWVARDAMHVTLRFFGSTDAAQLAALRALVVQLGARASAPIAVRAARLTGFPSAARAHVMVIEIEEPTGALASFAEAAEQEAIVLGFAAEGRPYRPHLTLARMRERADLTPFLHDADALPLGHATAITLYASTTAASGPVYTPIERVALPVP
jgi:2'-5' RNA ligase